MVIRITAAGCLALALAGAQRQIPLPYEESHRIGLEELARLKPRDFECPPCDGGREYRWPVKTLTDFDARRLKLTPVRELTVRDAQQFARPSADMRDPRVVVLRRFPPHERSVFRIRARVRWLLPSNDRDVHLFLADLKDPRYRMIAEVIDPACYASCAPDGPFHRRLTAARAALERAEFYKAELTWHEVDALVNLTGIGFFDASAGPPMFDALPETGRASNGFELHPVLDLVVEPFAK